MDDSHSKEEGHKRAPPARRCNGKKRDGGKCKLPAGHGTSSNVGYCSRHGGQLPRIRLAAERAELLREAQELAADPRFCGSPEELMLARVRATAAHAELMAQRVHDMADDDPASVEWHRAFDKIQRTAADTAARAVMLGLQERRQQAVERMGGWLSDAMEAGWIAFRAHLASRGVDLKADDRMKLFEAMLTRLEAIEQDETAPVLELPRRAANGNGAAA